MNMLELEIKKLIIESLNLEDMTPDDIDNQSELFGDGLGLDSIDALELGIALTKKYGIELEANDSRTRDHFLNVASLAELVRTKGNINR
jgi:acyl carrier protein